MWKTLKRKLSSRKLWAAIAGCIIVGTSKTLGINEDQAQWIATIVIGYIAGESAVDFAKNGNNSHS